MRLPPLSHTYCSNSWLVWFLGGRFFRQTQTKVSKIGMDRIIIFAHSAILHAVDLAIRSIVKLEGGERIVWCQWINECDLPRIMFCALETGPPVF